MVEGSKQAGPCHVGAFAKNAAARKASYDAVQRRDQEKKLQAATNQNTFGAWGPLFKNKQHFTEMHIC